MKMSEIIESSNVGDVKSALELIKKGADVNVKDQAGGTPLIWAATYC